MVQKFLGFFYRETNSLNQAALLLGFFAFLSQILAFLRDRLLAHIFGASKDLDIYYAAFRIPDLIFVTVASIVSISVLVPFIIEKDSAGREILRKFIDSVFSFFGMLMVGASLLAYISMPYVSTLLFKGFSVEAQSQVVSLSRLLLLSPVLLGLSNLFGSLTQAYNRFTLYALAPILYNAGIVIGIIALAEKMGVLGVAIGVIVGAALHLLLQVPFVFKIGLMPRFTPNCDLELIKQVAKISMPRTLTLSMSAITLLYLTALASLMSEGSISILTFAINLSGVPLTLIGVSYSLAAFPTLTRQFQDKNIPAFIEQMSVTARFIIFWSLPLTALFIVLRAQIVRVLLGSGQFDWSATRLTAAVLALFVLSAVFQSLLLLFMRGFYSAGFTKKPFYITLFSTGIITASAYGLVKLFYVSETFRYFISSMMKVEDLPSSVVLMLPLAFSIGTIINGILLWVAFEREFRGFSKEVMRTLFQTFAVSVVMGAMAYMSLRLFSEVVETSSLIGLFLQASLAGLIASITGVVIFVALKNRELASIWAVLKGKFWKTTVIATDPEIV
ncbi:MAG: lipid II flippase MurJ [bacterium]|nr:lipid II flippase MurJ [bacterium]